MAKRFVGVLWLVLGFLCGLVALAILSLGGLAAWGCQNNVRIHENIVDREVHELKSLRGDLNLPANTAKAQDLIRMFELDRASVADYRSKRDFALIIASFGLCPGFIALLFLAVFVLTRLRRASEE